MKTDELIRSLTADLPPVAPGAVARRLAAGLGVGAAGSAAVMLLWLGPRPDLAQAVATPMFWMKFAYAAATGLIAAGLLARLARPGRRSGAFAALAAAPFVLVAAMATMRFLQAPPSAQRDLLMGQTAMLCPWRILLVALPLLAGAVWALRGLAPTRLGLAGFAAGACAGGLGAAVYAVACAETSAPFLAIWYTLGIVVVAAAGALSSRFLRWR